MSISQKPSTLWDYDAYAAIPPDLNRHEIISGEHFVNPAPSIYHQLISRRIQFQLYSAIELLELGLVMDAPVDLVLSNHDVVQPDLVVVLNELRKIITPANIQGVPNLVVEIVSPSNSKYDFKIKRALYERFGVPEYWIVSPDDHTILQLVLNNGHYIEDTKKEQITTTFIPSVTGDLTKVW